MRKRVALCVGINDYPGSNNDLNGCVNDALGWTNLFDSLGYDTTTLLDADATRANVLGKLQQSLASLKFGDRFVFQYSGHGSWVPDQNGDEADQRDECIVLHDWQQSGFVTDDELYNIYQNRRRGVRVTAISDSCFSGTVARLWSALAVKRGTPEGAEKLRYFDAALLTPGVKDEPPKVRDTGSRPGTVLLSGCNEQEVSYDAWIGGKAQGAFSEAAIRTFSPKLTMQAWHRLTLQALDHSRYPQTPQLQATAWQRYWTL